MDASKGRSQVPSAVPRVAHGCSVSVRARFGLGSRIKRPISGAKVTFRGGWKRSRALIVECN